MMTVYGWVDVSLLQGMRCTARVDVQATAESELAGILLGLYRDLWVKNQKG